MKNFRLRLLDCTVLIISAGHTTTAESEHALVSSMFVFFSRGTSCVPQCWRCVRAPMLQTTSPLETAAVAPTGAAGKREAGSSPGVGPLLGGVVRSDDLGLRHHPVFILREGVAV